jgi:RND family efflux transporter MFP subunit
MNVQGENHNERSHSWHLADQLTLPGLPTVPELGKNGSKPKIRGRFLLPVLVLILGLGSLVAIGTMLRLQDRRAREETAEAVRAGSHLVRVVRPTRAPTSFNFSLPGSTQALTQATLYAQINGYLKKRLVDIGDHVEAGQLLAVIAAPEIDAQLNQARAQLEQYRAALWIAKDNYGRQKQLLKGGVVSQEEFDESAAKYNQAVANVKAAEANVQNLLAQQSFERITAPFAGTITARYTDVGAFLAVGTSTTSSPSLCALSQRDILRVFISVPQIYTGSVHSGMRVDIALPEFPTETFPGTVTRMADALDSSSRTEQVEIQLGSQNGKILPGKYLNVRFVVRRAEPSLIVPASTLVIRDNDIRIAVVTPDHGIVYKRVKLGRDFGTTTEILDGLNDNDLLVLNPPTDLAEGEAVVPQLVSEDEKGRDRRS